MPKKPHKNIHIRAYIDISFEGYILQVIASKKLYASILFIF